MGLAELETVDLQHYCYAHLFDFFFFLENFSKAGIGSENKKGDLELRFSCVGVAEVWYTGD